jgi:NAD(P)-dependent dehydrogenase (short-subunit alcohol dehydrogenase family)
MSEAASLVSAFGEPVVALVTGASRGIGLAVTRLLLADPGVECVVGAARKATTSTALNATGGSAKTRLRAIDMDIAEEQSIAVAAKTLAAETDRVDLVINCAGFLHDEAAGIIPERRLADIHPAKIARSFAVNATGPLLVAKHLEPFLPRRGRAVFASLSARVGSIADNRLGGWYGYRASKAAQNMFTRTLSIELKRRIRGIICVALHPGTVDTALSRPFQAGLPEGQLFPVDRAARQLLLVLNGLVPADNGGFFAFDGEPLPW